MYHAVGNDYLNYFWEYFMQTICMTFLDTNPNILGNFVFFGGQDDWERITSNIFPYLGVPEYFRLKICISSITHSGYSIPSKQPLGPKLLHN